MYLYLYLSIYLYIAPLSPLAAAAAPIHIRTQAPADPIKQPQRPAQAERTKAIAGAKKRRETWKSVHVYMKNNHPSPARTGKSKAAGAASWLLLISIKTRQTPPLLSKLDAKSRARNPARHFPHPNYSARNNKKETWLTFSLSVFRTFFIHNYGERSYRDTLIWQVDWLQFKAVVAI